MHAHKLVFMEDKTKITGERLRKLRREHGWSQEELGAKIDVDQTSVSNWERGRNSLNGSNLTKLSRLLNTNEPYLMGEGDFPGPMSSSSDFTTYQSFETWDGQGLAVREKNDNAIALPIYKDLEVGAGNGSAPGLVKNGPIIFFSSYTLRNEGVDPAVAFCVQVRGNSMEPKIENGCTIGINPADTKVVDGKTFAIDQDGLYRIKVLYRIPEGYRIHSHNVDEYPDELAKVEDVRIIGRVFWVSIMI